MTTFMHKYSLPGVLYRTYFTLAAALAFACVPLQWPVWPGRPAMSNPKEPNQMKLKRDNAMKHCFARMWAAAVAVALTVLAMTAPGAAAAEPSQAPSQYVVDRQLEPKEGDFVDFAPWCYTYIKGATDNPPESCWMGVSPNMLCGLMWESWRPAHLLEIRFIPGTGAIPKEEEMTFAFAEPSRDPNLAIHGVNWWAYTNYMAMPAIYKGRAGEALPAGAFAFTVPRECKAGVAGLPSTFCNTAAFYYSGTATLARFNARLYTDAKWRAPMDIEIEWGFPVDNQYADIRSPKPGRDPVDGRIEAYQGYVTRLGPLAPGGTTMDGANQWREKSGVAGRRGLRARVWLTDNPADGSKNQAPYADRTVVTLWTTAGDVSFAPSDLDAGPILIPSVGVFIARAGSGITAAQFQNDLIAGGKKTIRQRVREHRELNWASAMQPFFPGKTLPPIPEPPANRLPPGMTIDVPEKELNQQWRLSVAHIQANTELLKDGTYFVKIWPRPTALASESFQIIRAYDLIGLPQFAEGGLNFWLLSAKPVSPKGNIIKRDTYREHKGGHGRIQATAGFHYLMTRNDEWRKKVLPELEASYEHTRELRANWSGNLPQTCWAAGLLPPFALSGDIGGPRMSYNMNAYFFEGMIEVANLVTLDNAERGGRMRKEAEEYRQAIRRSLDRAVALTPVMKVQDGTYRRYMPYGPYMRGLWPEYISMDRSHRRMYYENVGNGLSACWLGVYAPGEPVVQETLDIVEDLFLQNPGNKSDEPWFKLSGYHSQCGHEPQSFVHFLAGDVPLAIRALYAQYASLIKPDRGYYFQEHPYPFGFAGDNDKSFEEAVFLERVRMLLVQEDGDALWLARFALREWFEQGKKISVKDAPTFFGPTGYEIVSDVDNGKINATVELPARNAPSSVLLRFRHPKAAPIQGVTVNSKEWKTFDKDTETIELKGLTGTVSVTARY